jgi:hypothetical protein
MMNKPALSGSEFMTSATPKPRAGEHTLEYEIIAKLQAERDLLREHERELREALAKLLHQLDFCMDTSDEIAQARSLLAKHGR